MRRTLILVAISLSLCLTANSFQGGGKSTKKGLNKKKAVSMKNSTSQTQPPTQTIGQDALAPSLTVDLGKNVKLEMVLIKAGSFMMGGNENDDEKPVHRVNITKPFYLGKYEVTQSQWGAVMGNNPSYFKDCGGNCPVDNVDWYEAQQFVKRLNARRDGHTYRLPTEAEWEYAARSGTTGDYAGNLEEMAWYGRSRNSGGKTHSVGQKKPNAWGLYDMHGNVYEWVQDRWHDNYTGAPMDGSAWESGSNNNRPLRGGSWFDNGLGRQWRSAYRNDLGVLRNHPGTVGFRVVMAIHGTTIPKPRPHSQTIEGTVIGDGSTRYVTNIIIESAGKRYSLTVGYNGKYGKSPTLIGGDEYPIGTRVRVTYTGTSNWDNHGITDGAQGYSGVNLEATRVVTLDSRTVDTESTQTGENGFQVFFKEFSSAARKRDRTTLELMMSPKFELPVEIVPPSLAFNYLDRGYDGWKQVEKSVTTSTKPYKDSSPQTITRVTNDNLLLFGLGSDGKWRWLRFLGY